MQSYPVLCGSPPLFITSTVSGHSTAGESFRESAPLPTRAHSAATLENFLPNRKNTDKMLSVRCNGTAEQMFGAHIFFFFFASVVPPVEGSCRLHNWDYTLSPRGRASANKKKTRLCGFPALPPSLSCQQETGRWGESCLLWTSCPPMMPSSFKNKGLTKVHDYSVAHHASRPGRLTKQRDWTEGRRLTGRVNPRVNTAAQASIPQWMSCQGISSSRGSL